MSEKDVKPLRKPGTGTDTPFVTSATEAAPGPGPAAAPPAYTEEDLWCAYEYAVLSARGEGGPSTRKALLDYVKAHKKP